MSSVYTTDEVTLNLYTGTFFKFSMQNYYGYADTGNFNGRVRQSGNGSDHTTDVAVQSPAKVIFGEYPVQLDVRTAVNGHIVYRVDAYFSGGDEQEIGVYHSFADFTEDIPDAIRRIAATSRRKPSGVLVSGRLSVTQSEDIADRLVDSGMRDISFISLNARFIY